MPESTVRRALPPQERSSELVDAAERVFAAKGLARTSITDVAREAGVTRGLVYHYFPTVDDLADAVLDRIVAGFVEAVRGWDAARTPGDVETALRDVAGLLREQLTPAAPLRIDLRSPQNAALYLRFVDRAVDAVVDCLQETTVEAYSAARGLPVVHVRETFVLLMHGLIALARTQPALPRPVVVALIRQTLHLPDPTVG